MIVVDPRTPFKADLPHVDQLLPQSTAIATLVLGSRDRCRQCAEHHDPENCNGNDTKPAPQYVHTCMQAHMSCVIYIPIYIHTYIHTYMYIYIYIHTYIYIHIYIHIYIYICIHIYIYFSSVCVYAEVCCMPHAALYGSHQVYHDLRDPIAPPKATPVKSPNEGRQLWKPNLSNHFRVVRPSVSNPRVRRLL